ncbi:hypothetical protein HYDPIDRAFT_32484 [Hydnomerulius pinastri MD-312]|uniref:Uncharacterized protein n=1 Tax=Hydnomerulius pinastri MD-312 TaxID=994086 RepID=A0A0C9V4A3_9AGAM|nr:hypothetical protein HYDPIDRAFT_32484 [Hydnomerulius pinastri MD-312]
MTSKLLAYITPESALGFLLLHDPDEAQHLGLNLPLKSTCPANARCETVLDADGFLTVTTTSRNPLEQNLTVRVPSLELSFTRSGQYRWPREIPYPIQDCQDVPGILYLVGENPQPGPNGFNAQQFPKYPPLTDEPQVNSLAGRVVIDFWSEQRITGVFKTNADNYVSGGNGMWVKQLQA